MAAAGLALALPYLLLTLFLAGAEAIVVGVLLSRLLPVPAILGAVFFLVGTWMVWDPNTGQGGDGAIVLTSDRNGGTKVGDIADGLSNTIGFTEVKAYGAYLLSLLREPLVR